MKTKSSKNTVAVTLEKNSKAENCEIGVIKNFYSPTFEANYRQAVDSLNEDINSLDDNAPRLELRQILYKVNSKFVNSLSQLEMLMEQISCEFGKLPQTRQIRNFLIFSVVIVLNTSIDIENYSFKEYKVNEADHWLFSPHPYSSLSIEKSIAKIYEYIMTSQKSNLKDGICFIADLLSDHRFNCTVCTDGVLHIEEDINILSNFMDSIKPIKLNNYKIQKDYFNLHNCRNLVFKCGNCISNLEKIEDGLRILNSGGKL